MSFGCMLWEKVWLKTSTALNSGNLFLLANLVLMSSQGVRYGKESGQNSHSLGVFFICSQQLGEQCIRPHLN